MTVYFYTFSKRVNSTAQPTGGTSYTCVIKDGSGVVRPRIALQWSGTGSPAAFNYAYIADFGRYYFIDEWTFVDRQWIASMHSDVLATAKTQIGSSSKLVIRSASTFDQAVADSIYPAKGDALTVKTNLSGLAFATTLDNGRFVVGIVGQGNTFSTAGAGYVVLTGAQLQALMNACFTETDTIWSSQTSLGGTIGEALARYGENFMKSVQNPIQFINSVVWLPFEPDISGSTYMYLGLINSGSVGSCLGNPITTLTFSTGSVIPFSITANDGYWKAMEPYCRYTLHCPPFGSIPLNGAQVVEHSGVVSGTIKVDCMTGQAVLYCEDYGINVAAQLGIPIQLSGSSIDYAGQIKATAATAGGIVGNILSGNIAGAVTSGVNGVIDTMAASMPQATNGSIGGGLAALNSPRYVETIYYGATQDDNAEKGRPLMQIKTISSLSGFTMCADGEVAAPLSSGELRDIESFLTRGFFYE